MPISFNQRGSGHVHAHNNVSIPVRDILPFLGRCLGSQVKTPDGVGTLVEVSCPHNGLYYTPEQSRCVVWFGAGNGAGNGRVSKEYSWTVILTGVPDDRELAQSCAAKIERYIDIGKDEHGEAKRL